MNGSYRVNPKHVHIVHGLFGTETPRNMKLGETMMTWEITSPSSSDDDVDRHPTTGPSTNILDHLPTPPKNDAYDHFDPFVDVD